MFSEAQLKELGHRQKPERRGFPDLDKDVARMGFASKSTFVDTTPYVKKKREGGGEYSGPRWGPSPRSANHAKLVRAMATM